MGKGKGGFDHWGMNAQPGKVLWELSAPDLRVEIAREVLLAAGRALPGRVHFVDKRKLVNPAVVGFLQAPISFAGMRVVGPIDGKVRAVETPTAIISKHIGYEKMVKTQKGLVRG
jgi:hypothetical protein